MRVTLLGTGGSAGVPHIGGADGFGDWGACDPAEPRNRRTRASAVIEGADGRRLLVDTSPDMRAQLLATGIGRVDAILFTHSHADHILGLDDVRLLNRSSGTPLDTYGTAETLDEIARRFDYAFRPWWVEPGQRPLFFRPVLNRHDVTADAAFEVAGMTVQLFEQDHGFMKTVGLRVGKFAYSTDVVGLDDRAFGLLEGVDTWVVDCFQRRPPHRTHAHFPLVLEWAARVGARRTILTHMGHDMDFGWVRDHCPPGVEPGVDGMILEFADP